MKETKHQIRRYADSTLDSMPEHTEWVWGCCPAHIRQQLLDERRLADADLSRTMLVPSGATRNPAKGAGR